MTLFDAIEMLGGLCLFLFGMSLMGQALERRAGGKLHTLLSKLTSNKMAGFLTGCGITAVIQSSSATTVMVVGFVNSGIMSLKQAINVIMGANVGTTITGWILSLGGIDGNSLWVQLLKPSSFTPILALVGIIYYLFLKKSDKKDTGMILLGFATLMFGMETMTKSVSGLGDIPAFRQLFIAFQNPVLGLIAGAVLTAVIQSSSASVGILQAFAATGAVTYGAAIPIIMGDAIGTCVTAMLSSVGAKRDAKRAAVIHLAFNIIGAVICLLLYSLVRRIFAPVILNEAASLVGIAIVNTAFKILSTAFLLPASSLLEKIAKRIIPDAKTEEKNTRLDERLLATPPLAIMQSEILALEMAAAATVSIKSAVTLIPDYSAEKASLIRKYETECDTYEDMLGTYLIKIGSNPLGETESETTTALLKMIGDFERISDHAVNILESAEELHKKQLTLSEDALREYRVIAAAVSEVMELSYQAVYKQDMDAAQRVEPLEQVIDGLKEALRTRHILRMQQGKCTPEVGFVWSDLLTNFERVSDHCSNVAGCLLDSRKHNLNLHETLNQYRRSSEAFKVIYEEYRAKYAVE